jgi:hypothetical protein
MRYKYLSHFEMVPILLNTQTNTKMNELLHYANYVKTYNKSEHKMY